MKRQSLFRASFAIVMLGFVLFLVWYAPAVSQRSFELQDVQASLETSRGRERKQQHEYDQVVAEIPEIQAELDQLLPKAQAAEQTVAELKAERKQLRAEKKELESRIAEQTEKEGADHD